MTAIQCDCPNCPYPCKDRHRTIWNILFRERGPEGGRKGLVHRFAEQVARGGQGRAPWVGRTIRRRSSTDCASCGPQVKRYRNSYNAGPDGSRFPCPDTPLLAEANAMLARPLLTEAYWRANNPAQMSTAQRVGWGLLGVGGLVVTGVAILSPFEGPVGDAVAGAATIEAWRRALTGAAAVGAAAAR